MSPEHECVSIRGPLARTYYPRTARTSPEARGKRGLLFGRFQ